MVSLLAHKRRHIFFSIDVTESSVNGMRAALFNGATSALAMTYGELSLPWIVISGQARAV